MRRSPLKRRLYRPPRREPFPPELHAAVLVRDRECVAAKLWPADHVCRTVWGREHRPDSLQDLTMEHIKEQIGMVPRIHDLDHVVALCGALNAQPPTKVQREAFRGYLDRVNGTA